MPIGRDLVLAHLVLGQLGEEVRQRVLPDAADPLRRQLEATLAVLDQPGLLQHAGQLGQALQRAGGVVAQQVPHPVEVGLGQRARARRAPHQVLQLVDVTELLHHVDGLGEAQRVHPLEAVGPVPAHLGELRAQVLAQLVHLPAQVHVVHQLVHQLLELRPLLGRHRVEHGLHGRHPLGHDLEQLVERLRVLGEEVAEALHELLEPRILALLAPLQHLVEAGQHVLEALHLLRRDVLHARGHLVDVALHELLAELVEQLLEALRRLLRGELVALELPDLAGQVGREHVELHVVLGGGGLGQLLAPRVAALPRLADVVVERLALLVDDVAQLLRDVVVDAAEVVLLEQVGTAPPQLLHQLPQPLQPLAVAVPEAALHHAPQGVVEIAVVQQVVGDLGQHAVGVQLEADLRPVPAGVREAASHGARVSPPAGRPSSAPPHRPSRPSVPAAVHAGSKCKLLQALGRRGR